MPAACRYVKCVLSLQRRDAIDGELGVDVALGAQFHRTQLRRGAIRTVRHGCDASLKQETGERIHALQHVVGAGGLGLCEDADDVRRDPGIQRHQEEHLRLRRERVRGSHLPELLKR